jgi:hypothetical protein
LRLSLTYGGRGSTSDTIGIDFSKVGLSNAGLHAIFLKAVITNFGLGCCSNTGWLLCNVEAFCSIVL